MIDPHAHHILFKKGREGIQEELVKEGQEILRKYDIDPIWGKENLVCVPNRIKGQYITEVLERVVVTLREAYEEDFDRDEIINLLKKLGQEVASRV